MAKKNNNQKHKQAALERVTPKQAAQARRLTKGRTVRNIPENNKGKHQPRGPKKGITPGTTVTVPGTPGVPTPTPDPFFTPDDLLAINDYMTQESGQLNDIDARLEDSRIQKEYDLTQAEDQFKQNLAAATDDMIGRGLFQSSVKDAAVYDLNATYGLQKTFLNDRFNQALSAAATAKDAILGSGGSHERFFTAMNQKKVQNAQDLLSTLPPYQVEPTDPHKEKVAPIQHVPRTDVRKGQPGSVERVPRAPFQLPGHAPVGNLRPHAPETHPRHSGRLRKGRGGLLVG